MQRTARGWLLARPFHLPDESWRVASCPVLTSLDLIHLPTYIIPQPCNAQIAISISPALPCALAFPSLSFPRRTGEHGRTHTHVHGLQRAVRRNGAAGGLAAGLVCLF